MSSIPSEHEVSELPLDERARALLYMYGRTNGQLSITPRVVAVAQPAAGADWTVTVAGARTQNVLWIVQSIRAQLVTSATVANRNPRLTLTVAGSEVYRVSATTNQAAGVTNVYTWSEGINYATAGGSVTFEGLGRCFRAVPTGSVIATLTNNIDTADQWSAINMLVLEVTQKPADWLEQEVAELLAGSPKFENYPGITAGL